MSLLGSIAGAFGSSAFSGGMNLLGDVAGSWATNSAKESLNKNITETNYKIQKKYDLWTQEQDKLYEQWWQKYLYDLQNNEYYNLSKKYAQNTASWAVEGLKKAGLNPILAGIDSNLSSSLGDANPQSSGHTVGSKSVRGASVSGGHNLSSGLNLAQSMQSFSAANLADKDVENRTLDNSIKRQTLPAVVESSRLSPAQISANTAKSLTEAKYIDAQSEKVKAETDLVREKIKYGGNPSTGGLLHRGFEHLNEQFKKAGSNSDIQEAVNDAVDTAGDYLLNAARQVGVASSHPSTARAISSSELHDPLSHRGSLAPNAAFSDKELAIIMHQNGVDAMRKHGFDSRQIERAQRYARKFFSSFSKSPEFSDPSYKFK